MGHLTTENFAACAQSLLQIGIILFGFALMVRGVFGVDCPSWGIGRLIAPLVVVILRGLVVLAILGAIYCFAAQKLCGVRRDPATGTSATQVVKYRKTYEIKH